MQYSLFLTIIAGYWTDLIKSAKMEDRKEKKFYTGFRISNYTDLAYEILPQFWYHLLQYVFFKKRYGVFWIQYNKLLKSNEILKAKISFGSLEITVKPP